MIQIYNVIIEQKMIEIIIKNADHKNDFFEITIIMTNFSQFNIISMIFKTFNKSQHQPFGIKNKKYIRHNMNLIILMLKIIDIILKNSKSHFFANFEKHH